MSDNSQWTDARRAHVNRARAESLQKILEEAGYFRWPHLLPSPHMPKHVPLEVGLMNLLVDYLHITDKEGQAFDLALLQDLVKEAHGLFDSEPRFVREP